MMKTGKQKQQQPRGETPNNTPTRRGRIVYLFVGAIVVPFAAAIGQFVMAPNTYLSSQQRNQDALVFSAVGMSAALGLAVYLYFDGKRKVTPQNNNNKSDGEKNGTTSVGAGARPKDIWQVGDKSQTSLKKPKTAYTGKAFGSKYYYAHNDSNTTGGYKDGLKMEDYRMNGPRLLSKNGLSVDIDESKDGRDEAAAATDPATGSNNDGAAARITANDPGVRNITKYLWDDPGNAKGIATIRVDVLPGDKLGEFVDFRDVAIRDVVATLPGEGLLAKIIVEGKEAPSYRLKIGKLYGDAADVKVIIKPKRLLIKVYKKKFGYLSKNDNNLEAWPQPHRKI